MKVVWFGTAGFRIKTGDKIILIDPLLSRLHFSRPSLNMTLNDIKECNEIFLTHGHIDHIMDVPKIVNKTGAEVYCSINTMNILKRDGIKKDKLHLARDGDSFDFGVYQAECYHSKHILVDLPLVLRTIKRALPKLPWLVRQKRFYPEMPSIVKILRNVPKGRQMFTWRFTLKQENSLIVQHMCTARYIEKILNRLNQLKRPHILMLAMQGHTHLLQIAAHIIKRLKPQMVIPNHHDDSFPPITQMIDLKPFVNELKKTTPDIKVKELPMGEEVEIKI